MAQSLHDETAPTAPDRAAIPAPAAAGAALLLAVAAVTWSKWWPYAHKLPAVAQTDSVGSPIFRPADPSGGVLRAAADFTVSYGQSVWKALLTALVIAAVIDALLPRRWLLTLLEGGRRRRGTLAGGLLALPTMMCTCCVTPIAVTMRRRGVSNASALAFWIGNPVLNPVVLVFLALTLPWHWVALRIVTGVFLVFFVTRLVARLGSGTEMDLGMTDALANESPRSGREMALKFCATFVRLAAVLVPEYLLIVFGIGIAQVWLSPSAVDTGTSAVLAALILAVLGTLLVIPTAGEVPVIQGLLQAGFGAGPVGALLVTLPAVSLPSLLMLRRAFAWRVLLALAGAVVVLGLVDAAVLGLLA
ncbi:permease [Carbonactinospora thermoautotrophica]|uniref:permease n=1 Tax=Carbonactinospora thermoautotrophica TaxID=1469144 RepID=UPI00226DD4C0|nr:permease [Carbonactinospora thermoautotrophica]